MKTSDNGIVLAREINWLAIIIDHRMRAYFGDEQDSFRIDDIPPPELQVDMPGYTQIVRCLSVAERLVLALAIAPHLQPELLDTFLTRNDMTGQPFTEFGGVTTGYHKGVIPTGQTAIFLLAGNDIYNRMNALQQLRTSVLFRKILSLGKVNLYEPVLNGPLVISDEHLYEMISMAANPAAQVQLARQIDTDLEWDDMVLDETTLSKVNEVNMWIKHASTLVGDSELRKKLRPGYRCLFYGAEGTGKRTVACLIGKTAGKDVYRVDLATIVSEYIGETEKNLSTIFDEAKTGDWILFFDEADALFGKRTETRNANDRYANQQLAYLLQRIEEYPGLIIVAANMRTFIDEAFKRRFQSTVHFPVPDAPQRYLLLQKAFNTGIPVDKDVDLQVIAGDYELTGGDINDVLTHSNLQALDRGADHITMQDILVNIHRVFKMQERTL